jgi:flagellar hook-length control protein FliK
VSSTASNVSATPAVQSSPWPQTPAATQDSNAGPFAALLDAAAAPDKTNTQPVAPKTLSAADQPAAKFSFGLHHPAGATGATGTTQNPSPDAKAAAATNSAAVTGPAGANSTATANPPATANATTAQPGATAPADIAGVDAALNVLANATLNIATGASGNATTPQQTTKPASDGGKGNPDDPGAASNAGAATATAPQAQQIAALISANTVVSTPPTASNAAPSATIGGSATVGAISALPFAGAAAAAPNQDANNAASNAAPAQQTNDASSAQNAGNIPATQNANPAAPTSTASNAALSQDGQIPAAQPNGNTVVTGQDTKPAAPARDGKLAAVTPDASVAVPAQSAKVAAAVQGTKATEATKQSSSLPLSDPTAAAGNADAGAPIDAIDSEAWSGNAAPQTTARGGSAAPHLDALATADAGGSSSAPSGWNAAKAVTDGLPNFGIAAATQTASVAAAATPGTAATATVPVAGLAVAIAARAQAGSSQFDIRLDPPELGRIDVRLDVDRNGQVTSHVTVDRADTLQLLQSQQPQLERALEQAGLKTADNGLQFTLRDQSFTGQNGNGGTPSSPTWLVIPDADQPAIPTTQIYSRAGLGSGVDIRV